ncbi:hypothetical protein CDV36_001005 [Fusarium kuroshium]|uniref:Xylanolytic transcriptional activator regulatory domain-containing protein n=1 Tax=Fusarium kuroshium TaxID=2010991 RepID=A0A3M2SPA6_9HYPO|nr:hypothetical protein CDV36_001005 [Fusarium kuroshium]
MPPTKVEGPRSNRPNSAVYRARRAAQGQPEPDDRRSPIDGQARARRHSNVVVAQGTAASTSNPPPQSVTGSPANRVEHEDTAVSPDRSASALRLVGKIFQKYHVATSRQTREIDAIPSLDSPEDGSASVQSELVPVADLIGISLPPREVVDALLDSYRDSVQWYIGVLHEPFLRERLLPIVETGLASPRQRPVLLLALIVLAIGARFISDEAQEQRCPGFPLAEVASNMVAAAERWYLPSMDFITVDIVAYSYLLATYYLWNRQTRAAFITTGTTIRAAQFIGLNQETQWGNISAVEKEARRRVWWSVFIGAGFISMSWGTPPMLSEADCNVRQPVDIEEDAAEPCPGFGSLEKREDGEFRPVTIGSYNRYKAEMYKIAITIMRQIYFTKHRGGSEELCRLISGLHQRLLAWERCMPPELRLESHTSIGSEDNRDASLRRVFAIQALTLRVSYDNVQIFLFRPLIHIGGVPRSHACTRESSPSLVARAGLDQNNAPSSFIEIAQQQAWTSATRTSLVAQRPDLLRLFEFGFPAIHVGVHAFSAGVMLGLLALLGPLSARGQESKRGIARIIQIPKTTKLRSHVWSQMTDVLTDLMHVIAVEETKALIADPAGLDCRGVPTKPDLFGEPPDHYSVAAGPSQRSRSSETEEASTTEMDEGRSNERDFHGHLAAQFNNLQSAMAEPASVRQDFPESSVPGHVMPDAAYSELFDMPDFLASPQAAWPAGLVHPNGSTVHHSAVPTMNLQFFLLFQVLASVRAATSFQESSEQDCLTESCRQDALAFAFAYGYPWWPYAQLTFPIPNATTNHLYPNRDMAKPGSIGVVRPNADTLYTTLFFDLSTADLVLTVPKIPKNRYWVFPFSNPYGDNLVNIGSMTNQTAGDYLIRYDPINYGVVETPNSPFVGVIYIPSAYGVSMLRVRALSSDADVAEARKIQAGFKLRERRRHSRAIAPPLDLGMFRDEEFSIEKHSIYEVALRLTAKLAPYNLPYIVGDRAWVTKTLRNAGINGGRFTIPEGTNLTTAAAAANNSVQALLNTPGILLNLGNGWTMRSPQAIGKYGSFYSMRYFLASRGYLALTSEQVLYPSYTADIVLKAGQSALVEFPSRPKILPGASGA